MKVVNFQVNKLEEGGFVAAAIDYAIITQADDWIALETNARDAVTCHFENPSDYTIRLHLADKLSK